MKRIATYNNDVEATYAKQFLELQGISAVLENSASATALSFASPAIGGVRLYVDPREASAALAALEQWRSEANADEESWWCTRCREEIEAGFACCWKCGQDREIVGGPVPLSKTINAATHPDANTIFDDSLVRDGSPSSNPYAAPTRISSDRPEAADEHDDFEESDELIVRAWRASIIGLFVLPILMHLYSVYLLIDASRTAKKFSPRGYRLFYITLVIDLLASALCALAARSWLLWII